MSLKLKIVVFFVVSLYLLGSYCHVTDAQDPNQQNGNAPQMTPVPPTSTTKKSSFFGGIKNWFKGSTTTVAPTSGTVGAALVGSIHPQSTGSPTGPTSSNQSPTSNLQPTGSSVNSNVMRPSNLPVTPATPSRGPVQDPANRDFITRNMPPGNLPGGSQASLSYPQVGPNGVPIRPPSQGGFSGGMLSYSGGGPQNQPTGNRDFANTNVRPVAPGGSNQVSPMYPTSGPGHMPQPQSPASPTPGSPTRGSPTPGSPTPGSPTPGSPTPGSPTPGSPTPGSPTPGSPTLGSPTPGSPTRPTFAPLQPSSGSLPQPPTNRDYVNTNIRPGSPTGPNQSPSSYPQSGPGSLPAGRQPQPPTNRDYVNPNARPGSLPGSMTGPLPGFPGQGGATPKAPGSAPSSPGSPTSPWGNTPQLTNQNIPLSNKDEFPPLPSPGQRPASPGRPGQSGVNFVPRPSTPSGHSTPRPQLATDEEITALTETLFTKDVNNQQKHVTINYQGQTRSSLTTDEAPNPLLQVNEEALHSPTIEKMRPLFNNYELDTTVNEHVTAMERKEENELLDALLATSVMRQAMLFLQQKGLVTPDPKTHRDLLKTIWFSLYSRGGGRIGSSAFEHIFLSEIKNNTVTGLHNWVYYLEEERQGHIDYKGYIKKLELGNKGAIIKFRFNYRGIEKPVNSMFIGTSPELEMALYTVCFQVRQDAECPVSLGGNKFRIQTYSFRYRGKTIIGSAFPEI